MQLNARRSEILQLNSSGKNLSTFDPCQPEDHKLCEGVIEKMRCNLLQLNQHCAFLIPSVNKIAHDHTYALLPADDTHSDNRATPEAKNSTEEQDNISILNDDNDGVADDNLVILGLQVTDIERLDIERKTRNQI